MSQDSPEHRDSYRLTGHDREGVELVVRYLQDLVAARLLHFTVCLVKNSLNQSTVL